MQLLKIKVRLIVILFLKKNSKLSLSFGSKYFYYEVQKESIYCNK